MVSRPDPALDLRPFTPTGMTTPVVHVAALRALAAEFNADAAEVDPEPDTDEWNTDDPAAMEAETLRQCADRLLALLGDQ
jgi:hypothetical protein